MTCDYDSIPEELRWTKQWLVAGLDSKGAPKVPNTLTSKGLRLADPTKLAQCLDFETARDFVEANPSCGLGFVVSASDQYVCVDLDIKNATNLPHEPAKWTSGENLNRFRRIIEAFASTLKKALADKATIFG